MIESVILERLSHLAKMLDSSLRWNDGKQSHSESETNSHAGARELGLKLVG